MRQVDFTINLPELLAKVVVLNFAWDMLGFWRGVSLYLVGWFLGGFLGAALADLCDLVWRPS